MKVTFLGHSGLLFEKEGCKIIVDPFLSGQASSMGSFAKRQYPVDPTYLKKHYNVVVITHAHPDHYDKDTLKRFFKAFDDITILAPLEVWKDVITIAGNNKCVMFNPGTSYTVNGAVLTATYAEHSEEQTIGLCISAQGERYYIAGDTLYNEKVFDSLPYDNFKAIFIPINGAGNTMTYVDAASFANRINTKKVVPVHFGLFDSFTGNELKTARPRVHGLIVPKPFTPIKL